MEEVGDLQGRNGQADRLWSEVMVIYYNILYNVIHYRHFGGIQDAS